MADKDGRKSKRSQHTSNHKKRESVEACLIHNDHYKHVLILIYFWTEFYAFFQHKDMHYIASHASASSYATYFFRV